MNYKRALLVTLLVGVLAVSAIAFQFYWQNLRGVAPASQPPPEDIARLINRGVQNATEFPLQLPDDLAISIFAEDVPGARVMAFDPNGVMLVSLTGSGQVVALPDDDHDGVANEQVTVASGLQQPHGLAFHCGAGERCRLYIAEAGQVVVYDYDAQNLKAQNGQKIIDLPVGGRHFTRTLLIHNDQLLISVGSSCNVCNEADWRRSSVLVSSLDGSNLRTFSSGLRNAVFMAEQPSTGDVWITEMGRDLLGDNLPPDEINVLRDGGNFGWPVCYGQNVHDTNFDKNVYIRDPCSDRIPARLDLQAHSAPLGLAFFHDDWPAPYRGSLLVAYHGSWNRSVPTGYKVVRYQPDQAAGKSNPQDFISGWLNDKNQALGRPVDIKILPGGVMYISDDKAGVIYRVEYTGE